MKYIAYSTQEKEVFKIWEDEQIEHWKKIPKNLDDASFLVGGKFDIEDDGIKIRGNRGDGYTIEQIQDIIEKMLKYNCEQYVRHKGNE